jgi:hypothetical protein
MYPPLFLRLPFFFANPPPRFSVEQPMRQPRSRHPHGVAYLTNAVKAHIYETKFA